MFLIANVTGYYAKASELTLVAISPPPPGQPLPVVHDIVSADLRFRAQRIKNICRLVNLATLIKPLADLVHPPDAEFEMLERSLHCLPGGFLRSDFNISCRDNGSVEIASRLIIKSYTGYDKFRRTQHLRSVYKLLEDKQVPHVDSLVYHYDTKFVLSPRGIAKPPTSEEELSSAIICVLEALEVTR